jgi:uncharacterized membrane protein HdeD (DUF308 family)
MIYYSLSYSSKVWLSSVFLAPLIFMAIDYCFHPKPTDSDSIIQIYFIITVLTMVFSIVTWLIFWGAATLACYYIPGRIKRKLITCFSGIILTIITFILLFLQDDVRISVNDPIIHMTLSNCLCIGAGSLFYNLGPDESKG